MDNYDTLTELVRTWWLGDISVRPAVGDLLTEMGYVHLAEYVCWDKDRNGRPGSVDGWNLTTPPISGRNGSISVDRLNRLEELSQQLLLREAKGCKR